MFGDKMEKPENRLQLYAALQEYHTVTKSMARIPEFVGRLQATDNLVSYVTNELDLDQCEGRKPVLSVIRNEESPVRLDLYWNPTSKQLDLDWDDADPYKTPHRKTP
ncbi:MAG TPA: hypothetical protein VJB13_05290 [Candidatus Nanoarchaeia archaeon]|nr:hypothetical protein [Candidatus Nanoarchaeia archaeon]